MSSAEARDPATLGAAEAARLIRERRLSPVALVDACLARIHAHEATLQAWVHLDADGARAVAREREAQARASRITGPLHGVPVGIKDIFHVAGMPTTGGARSWAHTRPAADATAVGRLRAAGAIILGKTATTEFAYRDPAPTRNPWNVAHTPGGSSAGSGAGVAARMVPLALGTQTVGSVLRPAAYCGVVGVKGTHGLVPVHGVIPLAWSLDHVGVLARSVADAALGLGVIAAREYDVAPPVAPRLAIAPELFARCEPDLAAHLQATVELLTRAGAAVTEVKLPASFATIAAAGLAVLEAEAAAYHQRDFAAHAAEYGPGIGAAVQAGLAASATAYVHANRARLAFRDDVMPILAAHHALLVPTAPAPAPAGLGSTGDASLCAPWSSIGVPAISLPSGLAPSGLPYAVQLVAAGGQEATLLDTAQWCEDVLGFRQAPPLSA
jgi:aspartyl-tRNA(Asn)/glutamyl-tRNA(Gln) amidotransferase subunit A